ncbi:MAG TPA: hypothetical protein VKA86_02325 [Candidatus Krumholzibacteria bacterium]|nr:hypothetical protein [Candidatus Krumholzibacteria bacterium]
MLRNRVLFVAIAVAVLAVATVFVHPEIALQGKVYSSSDSQAAAAFQRAGDDALEAGEFPHWNPFVFGGMPSYGSLAYNPRTYPLTGPIRLLREGFGLPPMTWLLVHYLVAALGVTGWLRWRCVPWPAAIAGGVLVLALPKMSAWGAYGHGTKLGTFAWMPFALWFAEAVLRRGRVAWAAGLALFVGLMLLRAHIQITYYAVLAIAVMVVVWWIFDLRSDERRRPVLIRTGWIAVAGLVGLGIALVLVLPVLEYQGFSIRGAAGAGGGGDADAAFEYATNWSLSWSEIATLWWPTTAGYGRGAYVGGMPFTDYPNYIGLPLLVLGLIGFLLRRDRTLWAMMALAVLSLLIALGDDFFLYRVLYELLPGFDKFRVPSMILAVHHLAVIVLAAHGLEALVSSAAARTRPRWLGRPTLVVSLSVALVLLLLGSIGADALRDSMATNWGDMAQQFGRPVPPADAVRAAADLAVADALRVGAILAAIPLVLVAVAMRRLPVPWAMGLIAFLLFLDLWRVQMPLIHPEGTLPHAQRAGNRVVAVDSPPMIHDPERLRDYTADAELTRWLRERDPRPRVFPIGGWESDNRLAARGIVSLGGYHAAKLDVYERLREQMYGGRPPALRLANLFSADWVVAARPFEQQTVEQLRQLGLDLAEPPALVTEEGTVYENRSALPRAWLVGDHERERSGVDTTDKLPRSAVLARVASSGFDPRSTAIVSAEPDPAPKPGATEGSVEVVEERYNGIELRVDTPVDGLLVVSDVWYPHWTVTIDGEEARMLRANFALRAVAVPAGEHTVEFAVDDSSYRTGRTVSNLALLLVLAGFAWTPVQSWRRRRGGENGDGRSVRSERDTG